MAAPTLSRRRPAWSLGRRLLARVGAPRRAGGLQTARRVLARRNATHVLDSTVRLARGRTRTWSATASDAPQPEAAGLTQAGLAPADELAFGQWLLAGGEGDPPQGFTLGATQEYTFPPPPSHPPDDAPAESAPPAQPRPSGRIARRGVVEEVRRPEAPAPGAPLMKVSRSPGPSSPSSPAADSAPASEPSPQPASEAIVSEPPAAVEAVPPPAPVSADTATPSAAEPSPAVSEAAPAAPAAPTGSAVGPAPQPVVLARKPTGPERSVARQVVRRVVPPQAPPAPLPSPTPQPPPRRSGLFRRAFSALRPRAAASTLASPAPTASSRPIAEVSPKRSAPVQRARSEAGVARVPAASPLPAPTPAASGDRADPATAPPEPPPAAPPPSPSAAASVGVAREPSRSLFRRTRSPAPEAKPRTPQEPEGAAPSVPKPETRPRPAHDGTPKLGIARKPSSSTPRVEASASEPRIQLYEPSTSPEPAPPPSAEPAPAAPSAEPASPAPSVQVPVPIRPAATAAAPATVPRRLSRATRPPAPLPEAGVTGSSAAPALWRRLLRRSAAPRHASAPASEQATVGAAPVAAPNEASPAPAELTSPTRPTASRWRAPRQRRAGEGPRPFGDVTHAEAPESPSLAPSPGHSARSKPVVRPAAAPAQPAAALARAPRRVAAAAALPAQPLPPPAARARPTLRLSAAPQPTISRRARGAVDAPSFPDAGGLATDASATPVWEQAAQQMLSRTPAPTATEPPPAAPTLPPVASATPLTSSSSAVIARATQPEQIAPTQAAAPAMIARAASSASGGGDDGYEEFLDRLRRDLLREREQMGDLLGETPW